MTKKIQFIVFVVILLLSIAISPVLAQNDTSNDRVITTSATGEVLVAPDMAQISIGVQTQSPDVKSAQAQNAVIMDNIVNALLGAGIAKDDIQTTGYSIYPVYENNPMGITPKVQYYQVTNTVQITVRDVNRVGEIIDIAVSNGANQASAISFTLSDEKARAVRNVALQEAVVQARADADTVAAATGVQILGVRDISVGASYPPIRYDSYSAAGSGNSQKVPTPIQPGQITESAQVTITYLIQ
jgi:uncharacterized protein YggE